MITGIVVKNMNGYFYVQDDTGTIHECKVPVSYTHLLVAHVVDPQPGELILDCCAAPGGKSMHMASLMNNTGAIMSCDIYDHKLELINQNAERLGVSIISTKLQDGRYLPDNWKEQFDRVLVDAPCSGLGILQKKLDMRWRKTESLLIELPPLQLEILEKASEMVKVNGYLVYSTCTMNSGENEAVLNKFLAIHKNFIIDPVSYKDVYKRQIWTNTRCNE